MEFFIAVTIKITTGDRSEMVGKIVPVNTQLIPEQIKQRLLDDDRVDLTQVHRNFVVDGDAMFTE